MERKIIVLHFTASIQNVQKVKTIIQVSLLWWKRRNMTSSFKRKSFSQNFFVLNSAPQPLIWARHSQLRNLRTLMLALGSVGNILGAKNDNICSCTNSQKIKTLYCKYWSRTWQIIATFKALKLLHNFFCCLQRNQFCDKIDWQRLHLMERVQESYKISTIFIWWKIICKINTEFFWYPPVGTEKFL